jgi:hypothetical protein
MATVDVNRKAGESKVRLLHMGLIVLFAVVSYANALDVPFLFDDTTNIVMSPGIRDFSHFLEPSLLKGHHQYEYFLSRYVGILSFAVNYAAHGLDARGYHVANILIHIINALLVYYIVVVSFKTPFLHASGLRRYQRTIALMSALLFLSHPVQTQAVTYIVQRYTSLATLFYLLSLALYIRARLEEKQAGRAVLFLMALSSAVLAMKTKETAFTLPLAVALYDALFFQGPMRVRLKYLSPMLLTILIIPATLLNLQASPSALLGELGASTRVLTEMSRFDYLCTEFRVIVTYLRLLVFPVGQNLDYDYPVFTTFFTPQVFLSFLLLAALLCLALFLIHRSRSGEPLLRFVSFGIIWFFLALSVESTIIPIRDVIFEHRMYLPSAGFFWAVASGAFLLARGRIASILTATFIAIALVFSAGSYVRNGTWKSAKSLWEDVVKKSPRKARGHNNLGLEYEREGYLEDAYRQYRTAVQLDPLLGDAHFNLGLLYVERGYYERAIEHFRACVEIDSGDAVAFNQLGITYASKGLVEEAAVQFKKALAINPDLPEARKNLLRAIDLMKEENRSTAQ